jgi:transposase InsO family protein
MRNDRNLLNSAGTDLTEANRELTNWLIFYNFTRPHQTLAYQTPMEYTNDQVSAMSPSSTCVFLLK